jgi:hypothetical protein
MKGSADGEELLRGPTLVVSAEGTRLGVGLLREGEWAALEEREGNAVEQLPGLARKARADAGIAPRHWIYSGGPGTLLGLRFTSLLLGTWARILPEGPATPDAPSPLSHRFSGMVWTARALWRQDPRPFRLLHRWRQGAWNGLLVRGPHPTESELFVVEGDPEDDPEEGPRRELLLRADARPSLPGAETVRLPALSTLREHLNTPGFLTPTRGFPPLQAGSSHYRKWTGGIHGAAPAP